MSFITGVIEYIPSIIEFFLILALLVLAHEFGHFIVAKKSGIRVDEFGLGFPPRLYGKKFGETTYTINAIPFGGFVKIYGEDPNDETLHGPDSKRSFTSAPKIVQVAVIGAGVVFNVILGWILISTGLMLGFPVPQSAFPDSHIENAKLTLTYIEAGTPAASAGLQAGDQLLFLESGKNSLQDVSVEKVQKFIADAEKNPVTILYKRGEQNITTVVTPTDGIVPGRTAIGIQMDMLGNIHLPFFKAFVEGAKLSWGILKMIAVIFWSLIADLFHGNTAVVSNLSGPIGIVNIVHQYAKLGFIQLLSLTAAISLNLAVINLVPIPGLDGGRLLFLIVEMIKGSPINPKIANTAHMVGFTLLLLLLFVISFHDIVKLL